MGRRIHSDAAIFESRRCYPSVTMREENHFEFLDNCDPLTPQRFHDINCRPVGRSGEQRLLLAMLEDAIQCFFGRATGHPGKRLEEQQEVLIWISGRWESPLSFDMYAAGLG